MGIAFVLLIWFVLWLGVAALCSLAFGAFTWWLLRRASRGPRIRAALIAIVLPPVSVVCGLLGFVGYGLWCEASRGVDAGIGDSSRVPLGSGYQLIMIDTMENAYIEAPAGEQFGHGVPRLGYDDRTVYFETARDTFQLIDKQSGQSTTGLSEVELAARLRSLGSPAVNLRPPADVYATLRWGPKDLLAIPMIFGLPVLLAFLAALYTWKVRRNASQSGVASHGA